MAVDFTNTEIDPNTGLAKKKQQQLPYLNENQGGGQQNVLPVVQPQATTASVQQGNVNVMGAAQSAAMQPQNTALQSQTQAMTQKMMTDPNFGYNADKNKTSILSNYDAQRAQAAQAARQQAGDVGGSGEVQENLLKTVIAQNTDRSTLENTLDTQAYETQKKNWQDAITAGLTQQKADTDTQTQAINNLLNTRAAYEGERTQTQGQANAIELQNLGFDQATQTAATQFGYDLTKLKSAQDFSTMSQDVANKQALALQSNDAATAEKLAVLKGQIDAAAQVQAQKNAVELQNLGYDQTVQQMAIQNGYDLTKLDKTFGNEMTKLITSVNLDTTSKSTLMQLQDKIDTKTLLTQNDFSATQAELDRQLKVAMQGTDAELQTNLTNLKGQIDASAQAAQNAFTDSQRIATQAWQTGETISEQDFAKATQYYDWAQKNAEQANDIAAQKYIEESRQKTELAMQLKDMSQEEKMTNLKAQLDEASANNDVTRQKTILAFTYANELDQMTKQYGFDTAKVTLQGNIEKALNEGEYKHAEAMQETMLQAQAEQAALDRGIENTKLTLQQQGIDLAAQESEWNTLKAGVDAGSIAPEALTEYLNKFATEKGITIEAPDPAAVYKEAQKQYTAIQQQYGLAYPQYVADKTTGELTTEGKASFMKFYNANMFGDDHSVDYWKKQISGSKSEDTGETILPNYNTGTMKRMIA